MGVTPSEAGVGPLKIVVEQQEDREVTDGDETISDAARRGRPRLGEEPDLDRTELERLLVHGDFETADHGPVSHHYPSFRELAQRFGVSKTIIQRFATRHNCIARRRPVGALQPGAAEAASGPSAPIASSVERRLYPSAREIAFEWVDQIKRGDVRIASAAELERLLRLAADLDAEARQRELLPKGYPTIEEIEDFCEQRDREYGLTSPGERGEIPIGLDDPSEPPPMRAAEDAPTE